MNASGIPGLKYKLVTSHYLDNDAAKAVSTNPVMPPKTKHIHIKFQYVLEQIMLQSTAEYPRRKTAPTSSPSQLGRTSSSDTMRQSLEMET